jgi:purine-cytosine permease-like protein
MVQVQDIPTSTGTYGARLNAIEPGGIEFIALSERHGHPLSLLWTWLSPNFEFATIFVGALSVFLFGASFGSAAAGLIFGTLLGSLAHGLLTARGPRTGVPQLVASRAAFGFWGNLLPASLNTFTASIGWFLINSVSGAFALSSLFGWSWSLAFTLIVVLQVGVATMGHNLVHVFERYALIPLGLIFGLACLFIFAHANLSQPFSPSAPLSAGGDLGAFILTTAAAFGYAAGWNPYAADFSRYLPPTTSLFSTGFWAGLGIFISCVLLELAGAALVTVAGTTWAPTSSPTSQLSFALPHWLYLATLLAIALGAVAANAINIYSGALSFLTLGIKLSARLRRALVALGAGALALFIGLVFSANVGPGSRYEDFLLLIGYWIAPWLGVVFAQWWLTRHASLATPALYDRHRNPLSGTAAFLVSLALSVFFFSDQVLYVGFIPTHFPALGDLTFVAGFFLAAALYMLFAALARSPRHSL